MKRPSGTKIKKGGVGGSSPSVPISAYTSAETGGQARADLYEVHHRILHHQEHPILSRVEFSAGGWVRRWISGFQTCHLLRPT